MGMDYRYAGSASYNRFNDEMKKLKELFKDVKSDDLDKFFSIPYGLFTPLETRNIYKIFLTKIDEAEAISQDICYELECCIKCNEGWDIIE